MNDLGEARDLKDERDSEAYNAMYDEVLGEHWGYLFAWEIEAGHRPDGQRVHEEAMRRLKAQSDE